MTHFYKSDDLDSHLKIYKTHDPIKSIMLMPRVTAFFKNYYKKIERRYIIYMGFESSLYKIDTCASDPNKGFTIKTHQHKSYGFSIYLSQE